MPGVNLLEQIMSHRVLYKYKYLDMGLETGVVMRNGKRSFRVCGKTPLGQFTYRRSSQPRSADNSKLCYITSINTHSTHMSIFTVTRAESKQHSACMKSI